MLLLNPIRQANQEIKRVPVRFRGCMLGMSQGLGAMMGIIVAEIIRIKVI